MFKKVHKSRQLYHLGKKSRQIVRFLLTDANDYTNIQ